MIAHPICLQEGGVCQSPDAWQNGSCNAARGALAKVRP